MNLDRHPGGVSSASGVSSTLRPSFTDNGEPTATKASSRRAQRRKPLSSRALKVRLMVADVVAVLLGALVATMLLRPEGLWPEARHKMELHENDAATEEPQVSAVA